jgi:hypothetical protein
MESTYINTDAKATQAKKGRDDALAPQPVSHDHAMMGKI